MTKKQTEAAAQFFLNGKKLADQMMENVEDGVHMADVISACCYILAGIKMRFLPEDTVAKFQRDMANTIGFWITMMEEAKNGFHQMMNPENA